MKHVFSGCSKRLKAIFALTAFNGKSFAIACLLFLSCHVLPAQVTLAFQGAEPGDTWGFVSTGADAVAQAQALMPANIVTGSASLVVGGNTPGGNCFDVGSGSGPNTARTFTFNAQDISGSNSFTRTLQFNWGNRFPVCVGTGWDTGENLVFTAFHDGVAQPPVTLATGVSNAAFNINANQYTWNIPPCVNSFYFSVSVTTNRRDELLFLDDVRLTSPAVNSPLIMPSPVTGDLSICQGASGTYSVIQEPGLIYTWSGLPAGAAFVSANGTTGAYTIDINWGTVLPGIYNISVTPSDVCGGTGPAQTASVTIQAPSPVSITVSGPTTFCPGGSVTLTSSASSGNTWSPGGSTASSIVVTTSGTYTLSVAGSCGTGTASETVTVHALPVVAVNNATTCPGVPVTLTATGADTYTWSPATGLSATTGNSVSAAPLATASYTVSGTDLNGCTGNATSTVTVNPAADATIASQSPLCVNDAPAGLSAASTGGTWSASCGTCIDGTGQFDPSAAGAGTHTVTYLISGSCGDTSTISVVVNPVPDVTAAPQTICSGQSTGIALSSTVTGASFSWTISAVNVTGASAGSGGSIVQALDVVIPPSGTVIYTVTPAASGCTGPSLNVTATVEDVVIDSIVTVPVSCNGMNDGSITISTTGATSYSIDGGVSFQSSPVFTGLAPATYSIVVQNDNGCSESSMAVITEPSVLVLTMSAADETCLGSCNGTATAAVTGGTTPYTYSWSNGAGNFAAIGALCTGTYTVTVSDNNGCSDSGSVTIGSLSGVSIDSIVVSDVLCNGGNTGNIEIYTTPAASQYSINGGTTFQPSSVFSALTAGTYAVVAQHSSGCTAAATVTVTEPAALVLNTSANEVVCPGQSALISANATGGTTPYTYTWDHGLPGSASHTVSPAATDTYSVYVTDSLGCVSATGVITLTVPSAFTVSAGIDRTICPGGSTLITAITAGGLAPYTVSWTNNLDVTVLAGADQLVSPPAPAIYTVTATDNCGTIVTDTLLIHFYDLPQPSFLVDSGRGCAPLQVNFTSTTVTTGGETFTWNFGDGSTGTDSIAQHGYGTAGCYDVDLQVTTADGCTADTTVIYAVCVYPVPLADFTFTPAPADVFEPGVSFVNLSTGANSWQWDFAGLGNSIEHSPSFVFPTDSAAQYPVCLVVESPAGCRDTTCQLVEIEGAVSVFVPNAFTPDGDGLNDFFGPVLADITTEQFRVLVYNRWGQLVFETQNTAEKWDGTQNGLRCKQDIYVWKIRYQEATTGVVKEVTGHVSLLR